MLTELLFFIAKCFRWRNLGTICLLVCGRRIFIILSYFSKSKWNNYRGYEYAYATSTVENEDSNVRRQTQRLRLHSQYGGMLSRRKCLSLSFTLNAIRVLMFSAANFLIRQELKGSAADWYKQHFPTYTTDPLTNKRILLDIVWATVYLDSTHIISSIICGTQATAVV